HDHLGQFSGHVTDGESAVRLAIEGDFKGVTDDPVRDEENPAWRDSQETAANRGDVRGIGKRKLDPARAEPSRGSVTQGVEAVLAIERDAATPTVSQGEGTLEDHLWQHQHILWPKVAPCLLKGERSEGDGDTVKGVVVAALAGIIALVAEQANVQP